MNPIQASEKITKRLRNYIRKSLPVERSVPAMAPKLDEFFTENRLDKEPILELVPDYKPGASLWDLAAEGIILHRTAEVFANYFLGHEGADPKSVLLHAHQEAAVRDACGPNPRKSNLVVCSGTGSGKTETFLIPLVDSLIREHQAAGLPAGQALGSGVRALILYPMNALVNDQIRRLRGVLKYASEITFGKFTGETEHDQKLKKNFLDDLVTHESAISSQAADNYAGLDFDDEQALSTEVTTRRKWRDSPAHILVTNYSMLERLLIQPQGTNLFGVNWKFIVLDEAHSYSGGLGTEIAWLIRRVRARVESVGTPENSIRYIATSATLISGQQPPEVKMERIRNEFASKLFPAPPDSFAVQFGVEKEVQPPDGQSALIATQWLNLDPDENLVERSQKFLGRKSWHGKLDGIVSRLLAADGTVAVGDLLVVVDEVNAAIKAELLGQNQKRESHLLANESTGAITVLSNFLQAGIGSFNGQAYWKEWLHDDGDPKQAGDGGKGNRLHLLNEWQRQDRWNMSREALEWMVFIATELAVAAEAGIEPAATCVVIGDECRDWLKKIREALQLFGIELQGTSQQLDDEWRIILHAQGLNVQGEGFQELLGAALENDGGILRLKAHLRGLEHVDDAGERATLPQVAEVVFPGDVQAMLALVKLVLIGTLAKTEGSRTPLLDARYHQLIRGVEPPGLRLAPGDSDHVEISLLPERMDDSLGLGVCRECGQPFALGYCKVPTFIGGGSLDVRSLPSAGHPYLHAFVWIRGEIPEGCDEPKDLNNNDTIWLDAENGKVETGPNPQNGNQWVKVIAHAAPSANAKEFISKCPTCGESQTNHSSTRYGIITPYEISGTQVKVIVLEELARNSDASSDPAAYNHPGQGRKVLAFSDSRSGAAEQAWRFQGFAVDTLVGRGIVEVARDLSRYLSDFEALELDGLTPGSARFQRAINDAQEVVDARRNLVPDFKTMRLGFKNWVETNNLAGLLAVAKVDQNDAPIGDLDLADAAEYRMLEALQKSGRNGILRKQMVMLSNQQLLSHNPPPVGIPQGDYKILCHHIITWMLEKLPVDLRGGFSREINFRKTPLSPNAQGQYLIAVNPNHGLNTRVRSALVEHSTYWEAGLRVMLDDLPGNQAQKDYSHTLKIAQLDDLRPILSIVCGKKMKDWSVLFSNWPQTTHRTIEYVFTLVRSYFLNKANDILGELWAELSNPGGLLVSDPPNSTTYRLNQDAIQILPGPVENDNTDNGVPIGHEEDDDLRSRDIIPLRCEEHTAQIASSRGSAYQRAFADGRINVLSCSTTFEMGVDLGDLSCVFLNGMPPAVANYRQRAGRAGRRPGSSSYVLTFMGTSSHDRYFWNRPGDLLFAPMDAPKIYLENNFFRARHLRAEAFHDFLTWAESRMITDRTDDPTQSHKRRWDKCGDFFIGITAGWIQQNGMWRATVNRRFSPVVAMLPDWCRVCSQAVQQRVKKIPDVGDLSYEVANDLVWQLLNQQDIPIAPYPLDDVAYPPRDLDYRMLGGCHLPDAGKDDVRRKDIQSQVQHELGSVADGNNATIESFQKHMLAQQTLTHLARGRALPIYGFPVDVISLRPDKNDGYGNNVKLERDLRIGLYEYAEGQVVTADKRRYPSAAAMAVSPGQPTPVNAGAIAIEKLICSGCHEPDWRDGIQAAAPCRYCGQALEPVRLARPDYFQARTSTPSGGLSAERGSAVHVHTGGFKSNGINLTGSHLVTRESLSGIITYINRGQGNQGFGNNPNYALYHDIRTDIAGWMLPSGIAAQGTTLHAWRQVTPGERSRWNAAMKSALHAILRAAARIKGIEDRDIGGLALPIDGNIGECGFVLFDESSGGGGVVLDLILTGKSELDSEREDLIRRILLKAIRICEECGCSQAQAPESRPLPRLEYLGLDAANRLGCRSASSCYNCLRSYRNQRDHEFLDRYDAAQLLKEILKAPVMPTGACERRDVRANNPNDFDFVLDDGSLLSVTKITEQPLPRQWVLVKLSNGVCAYGEWFVTERNDSDGNVRKQLRLLKGVGLESGIMLTEEELNGLSIWKQVP